MEPSTIAGRKLIHHIKIVAHPDEKCFVRPLANSSILVLVAHQERQMGKYLAEIYQIWSAYTPNVLPMLWTICHLVIRGKGLGIVGLCCSSLRILMHQRSAITYICKIILYCFIYRLCMILYYYRRTIISLRMIQTSWTCLDGMHNDVQIMENYDALLLASMLHPSGCNICSYGRGGISPLCVPIGWKWLSINMPIWCLVPYINFRAQGMQVKCFIRLCAFLVTLVLYDKHCSLKIQLLHALTQSVCSQSWYI